jgi:hypothetical protein
MTNDIEKLVEELKGIRGHLDALESAARGYMHDRFWKKGSLLEEQQKEFDEQAFPWALYNFPSPLEVIALRREAREQLRREAARRR